MTKYESFWMLCEKKPHIMSHGVHPNIRCGADLLISSRWGFDEEGELRTMWRRTGHPGFWFFGGNLALCRYFSRMLALQIKAMEEGIMKYDDQ